MVWLQAGRACTDVTADAADTLAVGKPALRLPQPPGSDQLAPTPTTPRHPPFKDDAKVNVHQVAAAAVQQHVVQVAVAKTQQVAHLQRGRERKRGRERSGPRH